MKKGIVLLRKKSKRAHKKISPKTTSGNKNNNMKNHALSIKKTTLAQRIKEIGKKELLTMSYHILHKPITNNKHTCHSTISTKDTRIIRLQDTKNLCQRS